MKTAVIIPTCNQRSSLHLVLEGFLRQNTDNPFQIIIVDDGSTEDVKSLVESFKGLFEGRLAYYYQTNQGRSIARNRGANECAEAELLVFNDSDRVPSPDFIEEHIRTHMQVGDEAIVIGTPKEIYLINGHEREAEIFEMVSTDSKNTKMTIFTKNVLKMYSESGLTQSHLPWISTFSGNMSIKKKLFDTYLFDENFTKWGFENLEFGYRLFKGNVPFIWAASAKNYHLAHARDSNFYEQGILNSTEYLKSKYDGETLFELLSQFLFGQLSLQDFERAKGNPGASWLVKHHEPVKTRLFSSNK